MILSLMLLMLLSPLQQIEASTYNTKRIVEISMDLLESALKNNEYFNFPNLNNEQLFITKPILPYILKHNILQVQNNIEYYFICSETEIIACITLCYENNIPISASLSTHIPLMLKNNTVNLEQFALIVYNGNLYIKTPSMIIRNNTINENHNLKAINELNESLILFENLSVEFTEINYLENFDFSVNSNIAKPRSSSILSVPYVPKFSYDTCWAAAAGALGRYYTGNAFSQYSAYDLASMISVGNKPASIDKSREVLSSIFHIDTALTGSMDKNTIINHINVRRPILAGFTNNAFSH